MKLYYEGEGDASVGIPDLEVKLETNLDYPEEKKARETLRKAFSKLCFEELDDMGGRHGVRFGDECPDCGTIKKNEEAECPNKDCINNLDKDMVNCPECRTSNHKTNKKCDWCKAKLSKAKKVTQ